MRYFFVYNFVLFVYCSGDVPSDVVVGLDIPPNAPIRLIVGSTNPWETDEAVSVDTTTNRDVSWVHPMNSFRVEFESFESPDACFVLDLEPEFTLPNFQRPSGIGVTIGLRPRSRFGTIFGRYMLSCRDSALVIRLTRSDYYSSLTMTRSIFHDSWAVFVYAEIVNTSRNVPTVTQVDEQHLVPFIIDVSTHHDLIPDETLLELGSAIEEVHPGSIQWVTIGGRRCFQYMKPQGSTTDVLPILQYTIHGSDTIVGPIRPLTIISILPRDYLKHVEDQHYVSRVHGIRGIEYQGIFGVPFLTQVSVIFDSGSAMPVIGFAEPI